MAAVGQLSHADQTQQQPEESIPAVNSNAVILLYHHVSDDTPAITSISPSRFEEQLNYLVDNNFTVLPLEQVVDHLNNTNCEQNLDVSSKPNRFNSSEDIGVGELCTWKVGSRLLDNHTDKSKHADTTVLQLSPASICQV